MRKILILLLLAGTWFHNAVHAEETISAVTVAEEPGWFVYASPVYKNWKAGEQERFDYYTRQFYYDMILDMSWTYSGEVNVDNQGLITFLKSSEETAEDAVVSGSGNLFIIGQGSGTVVFKPVWVKMSSPLPDGDDAVDVVYIPINNSKIPNPDYVTGESEEEWIEPSLTEINITHNIPELELGRNGHLVVPHQYYRFWKDKFRQESLPSQVHWGDFPVEGFTFYVEGDQRNADIVFEHVYYYRDYDTEK